MSTKKRFARSRTERMIGGVCGGIAEYFDLDPTLVRLGFALLVLVGAGSPILFYLILWVIMPPDKGGEVDRIGELEIESAAMPEDEEQMPAHEAQPAVLTEEQKEIA